jgi:hypothetical protein
VHTVDTTSGHVVLLDTKLKLKHVTQLLKSPWLSIKHCLMADCSSEHSGADGDDGAGGDGAMGELGAEPGQLKGAHKTMAQLASAAYS